MGLVWSVAGFFNSADTHDLSLPFLFIGMLGASVAQALRLHGKRIQEVEDQIRNSHND